MKGFIFQSKYCDIEFAKSFNATRHKKVHTDKKDLGMSILWRNVLQSESLKKTNTNTASQKKDTPIVIYIKQNRVTLFQDYIP